MFFIGDVFRLVDNAVVYTVIGGTLATTEGSDKNIIICQYSTIMRALTSRDGIFPTFFDKFTGKESEYKTLKQIHNKNHDAGNEGNFKEQLPFERLLCFCKSFKKVTQGLGFEINFNMENI